jgi:uncharacterized protein (TIGR02466 family)
MNQPVTAAYFPTLLLRTRVAEHEKIGEALGSEIERIRHEIASGPAAAWACPVYTTLMTEHELHRRDAFRTLADTFLREALAFAERKSVDLDAEPMVIDQCWLNVFARGESMDVHNHPNCFYTGYYFIEAPEDGTRLILYHPAKEMGFSMPVTRETVANQEGFTYLPRAGDLVLFESHIVHSFQLHDSPREHINLGFTVSPA